VTPLVIGVILQATGSFYGGLAFVGIVAFVGALSWIFLVGDLKPIESPSETREDPQARMVV
jgi:MFS transporter, ACS family, D-galactonate transporter